MEHQKTINLLDYASHQPSKFIIEKWTKKNDQSSSVYSTCIDIRFKTTILNSSL